MSRRTSSLLVGYLVGGCLLAIANPEAGAAAPRPTKAQFIRRGDAICARSVARTRAIHKPNLHGTARQILSAVSRYLDRVLPLVNRAVARLEALSRPAADLPLLKRYFRALNHALAQAAALSAAARRGDAHATLRLASRLDSAPADRLARRYGFKRCGGSGVSASAGR